MRTLLALLMLLTLTACAAPQPRKEPVAIHGAAIETLQGSVNIEFTSPAGRMGGNGVLFYKRPDSFRLTILAPFGQTVFDIVANGEHLLCLEQSKKRAWQGPVQDLPEQLGTRIWPLLTWVVEPPHPAGSSLQRQFVRTDGTVETVTYDAAGLVQKKVTSSGNEVTYSDYRPADGIAVPWIMEVGTAAGSRLKLTFDEPEVNRPIDNEVLAPPLAGYEILPLAAFKGF